MSFEEIMKKAEGVRKVGTFGLWPDKNDPNYSKKLVMNYEEDLYVETGKGKKLSSYLTEQTAIVYFIVVNGKIYKIGGSGAKGGIKALLSFYLNVTGAPGPNRYIINSFIHEELERGNMVEFYTVCVGVRMVEVYGPYGKELIPATIEHTAIESRWIEAYRKANNGSFPIWNFQECPKNKSEEYKEVYSDHKDYGFNRVHNI